MRRSLFGVTSALVLALTAAAVNAADIAQLDVPVTIDEKQATLHYTSETTPEAAARDFLKEHGLDAQANYDTHLRAISSDIRRRLNETVDLSWLERPVAASLSVNFDEEHVVEFRVYEGESAQVAAEEFCLRHNLPLENALTLAAGIMRRVSRDDTPYLLFQLPITVDNSTNYLNFYSDRVGDEQNVAQEFLEAVQISKENENFQNMTRTIAQNIAVRVDALGVEKEYAKNHTKNLQELHALTAVARARGRVLSGEDRRSGKLIMAFGEDRNDTRLLSVNVADSPFEVEFPKDRTTMEVATSFCEQQWELMQSVMNAELETEVSKEECTMILNEMMVSELVAEYEANQAAEKQAQQEQAAEQNN